MYHKHCLENFERFQKNKGVKERFCPICRERNYDQKPFVVGQRRYLEHVTIKCQALTRGFLARNAFYNMMIKRQYKPADEDMRKRLIGFKLGLINKRQHYMMQEERKAAGILDKSIDKNIKDTESLLNSFLPNVQRAMDSKKQRSFAMRRQQQVTEELTQFWQAVKEQAE